MKLGKNLCCLLIVIVLLSACTSASATESFPTVTIAATETLSIQSFTPSITPLFIPIITTPSPLPTQQIIPVFTPDSIQVEIWKEYQSELAKLVLAQHPRNEVPLYQTALCEWDILGRSNQEVYVWAICSLPGSSDRKPAVIFLEGDGSIRDVKVPFHGSSWSSTIQELFPVVIQKKIDQYFSFGSSYYGRAHELNLHLQYRKEHPEEVPLVVLSAVSAATPMP